MFSKIILIVLFFASMVGIGIYCRKKASNVSDFVLGGREVGPWLTAFAYGTSYFSAVVFVGYAGQFGWNYGISAFWIGIGNALIGSLLSWTLLGRRTRVMTKHLEAATMPEFFSKRYKSRPIKIIASVIIFIFLIPYSASVYKGLSGLFAIAFGVDFTYCIIAMALITAVYVIVGGYMATAINDFVQGIIMIFGIVFTVAAVLGGKGGFTEAIKELSHIDAGVGMDGAFTSLFGPDPLGLLSVVILTSLGTLGLPQMVHKFYTIKSEKDIKTGTVISTLFALIIAGGSYFMGGFGRLYYTAPESGIVYDDIVPTMLSSQLSDIMIGVVLVLVLSASMSTLSSLVISSSSTFVLDFLGSFMNKKSDKKQVVLIKSLCAVFILISVVIAISPNALITSLMSMSWGALAGAFLGPFIYGLFMKNVTRAAVYSSFISGVGIVVLNSFLNLTTPTVAGAVAMIVSLIIVPLVSLITPKLDKSHVESAFSCYKEPVEAKSGEVLKDQ